MRRRRAILYDDDPVILELLSLLFQERGYDVLAFAEPVACVVYEGDGPCGRERACADIMITDLHMPGMDGLALLESQARRGCPLTSENKAVLSGSLDAGVVERIRGIGCTSFPKPFRVAQLDAWLRTCEPRMDLSRPLAALRRERRDPCGGETRRVTLGLLEGTCAAEVVNTSPSGMCLRLDQELPLHQAFVVRTTPAAGPGRLVVKWTRPDEEGGGFLTGASGF